MVIMAQRLEVAYALTRKDASLHKQILKFAKKNNLHLHVVEAGSSKGLNCPDECELSQYGD